MIGETNKLIGVFLTFSNRQREQEKLKKAVTSGKERKPFNLEEEYEKMLKEIDVDKWESKRIPRKD